MATILLGTLRPVLAPDPSLPPPWGAGERAYFYRCAAASAVAFLVFAVYCSKFVSSEEYYQVVEFASLKLGISTPADLPWEYGARIRDWLQPGLYVLVARAAEALGIHRPLSLLCCFRLVTAVVSWASLWMLMLAGRRWLPEEVDRRRAYLVAALLWLLPYLGVRPSSETMSAAMLCIGIAVLEWRPAQTAPWQRALFAVLAGVAFGLCFEFRYASLVLAAGAGLSYLRRPGERLWLVAGVAAGFLAIVAIGVEVDRWGYGVTTFPALSYVVENFVEGRAAQFGTSPFFAYLYLPLANLMGPIVLWLLVATIVTCIRRPENVLVWATVLYVVALSLAAHKEARFLYPLAPFAPLFVAMACARQPARLARQLAAAARPWVLRLMGIAAVVNLVALAAIPFLDFALGDFSIYRVVEDQAWTSGGPRDFIVVRSGKARLGYSSNERLTFIEALPLSRILDPDIAQLEALVGRERPFLALVDLPNPESAPTAWVETHCVVLKASAPEWLRQMTSPFRPPGQSTRRVLHRCGSAPVSASAS